MGIAQKKNAQVYWLNGLISSYLSSSAESCFGYSDWATVHCGVPQGFILRPLLFIIYMNDLPNVICHSHLHLFADDITMYTSDADPVIVQDNLISDLASLFEWVTCNGFAVNVSKSQSMLLARRRRRHQLSSIRLLNNNALWVHKFVKYLGVIVDENLSWSEQVRNVSQRSLSAIAAIHRVSLRLSSDILITLYNAFILPYLTYCCLVWHFCPQTVSDNLQCVQNYAMRLILKLPSRTSSGCSYLRLLNWMN